MKKGLGVVLIIIIIAAAVGYMTMSDKGLGLQTAEVSVNEVSSIDVTAYNESVSVKRGDTQNIILSLMHNDRADSILDYKLTDGKLNVSLESPDTYFDLSVDPERLKSETLEIIIPISANIDRLKIETDDGDISLSGIEGTVEAQTNNGEVIAESNLGAFFQGKIGNNIITLLSESGNIILPSFVTASNLKRYDV